MKVCLQKYIAPLLLTAAALPTLSLAAGDEPQSAQQGVSPTFGDEVEVTVVNVDVYVRDREGRPVKGLKIEDFRVTQDGREVAVTNFADYSPETVEYRSPQPAVPVLDSQPEVAARLPARPIYVILYVDNVNLDPLLRNRVLTRVEAFVDETLVSPIEMMVVNTRPSLEIRQPFTDDPKEVIKALQDVATLSGGRLVRDRDRRRILDWMEEIRRDPRLEAADVVPTVELELEVLKLQMEAQIIGYAEEESHILRNTLTRIRSVIELVAGLDGRKSIIYVSNGLPMTPGLGLMYEFADVFRDQTIYVRQAQRNFAAQFASLADTANREGISLYSLDATGLGPLEGFGADDRYVPAAKASWASRQNLQDTLRYMADATAGLAVLDTNDVAAGLKLIRDDLFSYYSLGYTITAGGEDAVHEIVVELPGYPKHEIRHRRWFVEKSLQTRVQEHVFSLLASGVGENAVGELRLSAGDPTPVGSGRWQVPLRVSIPLRNISLVQEQNDHVGHVELFLGFRDARGRGSQPQRREYEVRIPSAQYDSTREQRYRIDIPLLVRGERHTVAAGVLDLATDQTSYGRAVLTVP
jgi:VWFA-related protein